MKKLNVEIDAAARSLNVPAKQLTASEAYATRLRTARLFQLPEDLLKLEHDCLEAIGVHDADIWERLDELFENEPLYLLFRLRDDDAVWIVPGGKQLVQILGERFGFVFYAVPESLDFIVCFNDHDYLVGLGTAAEWIERQPNG